VTVLRFPFNNDHDPSRVEMCRAELADVLHEPSDEFGSLAVTAFFSEFADGSVTIGDHATSVQGAESLIALLRQAITAATPEVLADGSLRYGSPRQGDPSTGSVI